ncbi:nuclease-related domain-containing protein [Butyrivibrio sp. MB2005]|uniref:nuclease-related domain-containing protein n=1 Tax=Butyrivibrio sp. MB2005 TaxID=1280678 RepID=UPI0009DB9979
MFKTWYVIILLIIVVLLSIVERFFILQLRGYLGERKVVKVLKSLPEDEYRLLNNVMLSSQHGLTQIDHILVLSYRVLFANLQ